jgi:hypothetical protein
MKAIGQYFLALLAGVVVVGLVAWAFTDEAGRQTVLVSGAVALVVQMTAFSVARMFREKQLVLGWGLGSLIRLISLVLYAVVVARLWRAPITPALLSFVGMLFVTTVVEPIFLKR